MSRLGVALAVVGITIGGMLFLIALEAKLTVAGERKLAAGASALTVAAAIGLVLELTLLASRLWARRSALLRQVGASGRSSSGAIVNSEEPRLPAGRTARRS